MWLADGRIPQSVPNLTESSTNLYELFKGRNLALYEDGDLRLAISRAVALETSRGWRITKEKQSHKIDVVVALAMAALGAVQQGQEAQLVEWTAAPRIAGEWNSFAGTADFSSEQFIRLEPRQAAGKRENERADRTLLRRQMRWGRRWANSGF